MRRLVGLTTALFACALVLHAQSPTPQQPTPTFAAGIDVVQMDVSVLDKARRPVKGLTAADFTVLEDGKPQPIVAFEAVDIPPADSVTAPWMRDAPVDVVTNERAARRVIVIVLDDHNIPNHMTRDTQRIAREVIDRLGPEDLAAVTVTNYGRRQDITYDHERLLKAINTFVPHPDGLGCGYRGKYRTSQACVIDTLVTAADALRNAPAGRKTLVYVSGGPDFSFQRAVGAISAGTGGGDQWGEEMLAIHAMFDSLRQANVNVYTIDPSGVTAEGFMGPRFESLRMFAEDTGGRATLFTNAPWQAVPQIFVENSSYYMIGFRSSNTKADGAFRNVHIKVNRPDLDVRSRSGYFAPDARAKATPVRTVDPIDKAIGQSLPGGDLRLAGTVAPFAIAGQKNAAVAIGTLIRDPLSAESRTIEVATLALDSDCGDCKKLPSTRQVVRFSPSPARVPVPQSEVLTRLTLAPGSYEIRIAASTEGRTGALLAHLDVPNFQKDKLSLSGLVFAATPAVSTGMADVMSDVLPIVPSALREFGAGVPATAFVRVYQHGVKTPVPVRVVATILDTTNKTWVDQTTVVEAAKFGAAKSWDYRLDLPIATLEAGAYLLTIEAHVGKLAVKRQGRFWVKER